jgi:hypothetical protein
MELILDGALGGERASSLTQALLRKDLGARINFEPEARRVRIEGRLSLDDARAAIAYCGLAVASVADATIVDASCRGGRSDVLLV